MEQCGSLKLECQSDLCGEGLYHLMEKQAIRQRVNYIQNESDKNLFNINYYNIWLIYLKPQKYLTEYTFTKVCHFVKINKYKS